jgi:L-fuculose-phosphate aldolase
MAYGNTKTNGSPNGRIFVSEFKLKEQMCEIGRRIWLKGFCAGNEGNHSFKINDNRYLCTPTGVSKGFLKPDDICVCDGEGKQIGGGGPNKRKRTSEFMLHLGIYKARPDVRAVIHSHPPHATAFAVANVDLPTCIHPEAEVFLGPVKTAKYVTPGDQRLGESILPYVQDSNTIILANHGVVCFHADFDQCYYNLEIVDAYSRILLLAKGLGSVRPLSSSEMSELLLLKEKFGIGDPRLADAKQGAVSCAVSDYMSRVSGDVGSKGRMATAGGTAPVPTQSDLRPATAVQSSPMEQAIHSMLPEHYSDADVEQLVQVITDQIMATAG